MTRWRRLIGEASVFISQTVNLVIKTKSGATDAPNLPAAARIVRGPGSEGVQPATTLMRSPDGKSQRWDDGGNGVGSCGN